MTGFLRWLHKLGLLILAAGLFGIVLWLKTGMRAEPADWEHRDATGVVGLLLTGVGAGALGFWWMLIRRARPIAEVAD